MVHHVSCPTAKEWWDAMTQEFQAKSAYAKADLHWSFLEMHCAKGGDVREFLANLLCYKKEELVATGVHDEVAAEEVENREENSVGDDASCSLPKVYLYTLWSTCVHKPLRGD